MATAKSPGWLGVLARVGFAARGVTYLLLGWLILDIAIGHPHHQASDKGAFETLAQHSWGKVILVLLGIGFAGYAAWGAARALTGQPAERRTITSPSQESRAKAAARRLGAAGQAVVYGFLCYLALALVVGAGSKSSGDPAPLAAKVLREPAGEVAVVVAGAVIIISGLVLALRGAQRRFEDDLRMDQLGPTAGGTVVGVGVAGSVARGLVVVLVGVFLFLAGIHHRAGQAKGLDASLVDVGRHPFGEFALVAVAAGIACFGLFSFIEARYFAT